MIDIIQLQQKFKNLPFEEQFQQLFQIFSHIREKNQHCAYIYTMMSEHKEMFDNTLLVSIFEEVIQVYSRIKQEKSTLSQHSLEKSSSMLHQLQQQEAQIHEQELVDIEKLLDF